MALPEWVRRAFVRVEILDQPETRISCISVQAAVGNKMPSQAEIVLSSCPETQAFSLSSTLSLDVYYSSS